LSWAILDGSFWERRLALLQMDSHPNGAGERQMDAQEDRPYLAGILEGVRQFFDWTPLAG
jgi:hypothetical protein